MQNKHLTKNQNTIKLSEVHLEHILTEKPKKPTVLFDNYDDFIQKIGNKLILDSKTNSQIQNMTFREKQEYYPKEPFKIIKGSEEFKLKSIFNYKKFEAKEINSRSAEISKIAARGLFKDFSG